MKTHTKSTQKRKKGARKSAAQRECDAVLGTGVVDIARLKASHAEALAGKGRTLDEILADVHAAPDTKGRKGSAVARS